MRSFVRATVSSTSIVDGGTVCVNVVAVVQGVSWNFRIATKHKLHRREIPATDSRLLFRLLLRIQAVFSLELCLALGSASTSWNMISKHLFVVLDLLLLLFRSSNSIDHLDATLLAPIDKFIPDLGSMITVESVCAVESECFNCFERAVLHRTVLMKEGDCGCLSSASCLEASSLTAQKQ